MANKRSIVKKLSYSDEFNSLSEFAQVLYLLTTPHLDDFGKIDGNPRVLKAMVLPLNERNPEDFEKAVNEMLEVGLVDCYTVDGKRVIKYLTFEEDQTGLNKRTKSSYPDNPGTSQIFQEVQRSSTATEEKRNEDNQTEVNKSEGIADKKITYKAEDPNKFEPKNAEQSAAKEIWESLEPDNDRAFYTTYLYAAIKGVPASEMYRFSSEIRQDTSIKNKGAVFTEKVKEYMSQRNGA